MLNVMVTGLLCISMLLVASSCNLCLFTVKFYWNIKKKKKNEVTGIFGNTSSAVVRATGKKLKFSCSLERSKNTSTTNLEPVKTFITATEGNILC